MYVTPRWLYQSGGRLIHRFQVDWPLTNRNDGRGHTYHRTARERKALALVLANIEQPSRIHGEFVYWPMSSPCVLVITRVIAKGERLWDADSVGRGNAKELIDTLVEAGYFHDDSPKWLRYVAYNQNEIDRPDTGKTQVQIWTGDSYSEVTR